MSDDLKAENKALHAAYKREKKARREAESLLEDKIRALVKTSSLLESQFSELKQTNYRLQALQNKLVQARQMETIGQVISGLLHELNNPLASIQSNAEFIAGCDDKLERFEIYDDIREAVQRVGEVIGSLASARDQELESLDLMEVLRLAIKIARSSVHHNIKISCAYGGTTLLVQGYRQDLIQLFLNVFLNALESGSQNVRIDVRIRLRRKLVLIDVVDNASNYATEMGDRIFEPFTTIDKHNQSSGTGLYTCFLICEKHHGKIKIFHSKARAGLRMLLPIRNI